MGRILCIQEYLNERNCLSTIEYTKLFGKQRRTASRDFEEIVKEFPEQYRTIYKTKKYILFLEKI